LKADFKAFLSEECKLGYKAGDKELMAIYECFKSAREVCVNSRPCFRKLVELDKKRDKQTIMTLEEKFKKINKKTKALYDTCVQYHGACVKELASLSSADLKKLTATQCMFDLFSDNAETKRKMLCLGKTPAPAKGPFPCAAVDTCLKTKK
ncbi:hypothetical protein KKF84_16170, partial [Myxococcota bacterium]|nr:hypothetical protein [Myxococcota bacterium]MBU1536862.1 hypothetical protein [Myxococcota bacterium]